MDESKLKEYLRRIITKELDEMSGTGALGVGAGEIQTPYWVHKGKGDNNATKEAERLGFKKVKTSMPSDSKVKDYKSLWGKKSKRKIYNESDYDKASPWGAKSPSDLPSPSDRKLTGDNYYKTNEMKNIYEATPLGGGQSSKFGQYKKSTTQGKRRVIPALPFPKELLTPFMDNSEEKFFRIINGVLYVNPKAQLALMEPKGDRFKLALAKRIEEICNKVFDYEPNNTQMQNKKSMVYGWLKNSVKSNKLVKLNGVTWVQSDANITTDKKGVTFIGNPGLEENLYETIEKLVKKELLNEVSYGQFKNEVKLRSKQEQLHKAMREVKRKLNEIERIVEYTGRMKQELSESEGGVGYWNRTAQTVSTIAEMVESLNAKIQNLK